MQIAILGNGVVGGCLNRWFTGKFPLKIHDSNPMRSLNSLEDAVKCDLIFVCIFLPNNGTKKDWPILLDLLDDVKEEATVAIRTTVAPETCERIQMAYPDVSVCFCPEFLTEARAWDDFLHPWIQVVGGPSEAAQKVMGLLPRAPNQMITTTRQAEWIKLATAGFLSTKVSWFNQLYDALGPDDYAIVSEAMDKDARVGKGFKSIFQDGYRGWGGKCFTKDTPCFAEASGMPLMQEVIDYNRNLIEGGK